MNKPSNLSFVRDCPDVSRKSLEVEEKREQQNPPDPPSQRVALDLDPVPLGVRKLRVANGSRRKRDLAAVAMAEELDRRERQRPIDVSVFIPVVNRLRQSVPDWTFDIWLAPLRPVGADGATLLLTAPDGIRSWVERRYTHLITEALVGTPFTAVEFVTGGGE